MTADITSVARPRLLLICHDGVPIHSDGIARWLASWGTLAGIVVIHEPARVLRRRLRREWQRVGLRLADALMFRIYYRLRLAQADNDWLDNQLARLRQSYGPLDAATPRLDVATPNSAQAREFMAAARPDLTIALCKTILAERVFSIPSSGTIVFHPGVSPEYRNAHGCFWALASDDLERVGLTVLRIDKGIDTGPVLGYFTASFDEVADTHIRIQHQVLLDNLDAIRSLLLRHVEGAAPPIDVTGRASKEWGQPWLSAYRRWKTRARRRRDARHRA